MHPNARAQLRSELALLPDLFDLSSSSGDSSLLDQSTTSSLPANPSQRYARECVLSGEDLGANGENPVLELVDQGRHFMCLAAGSNTAAEVDSPAGSAAPGFISASGSGELPSPSGAEPVGADLLRAKCPAPPHRQLVRMCKRILGAHLLLTPRRLDPLRRLDPVR
jgi:hypothetical protein